MKDAVKENFDGSSSAYAAYEAETGQFTDLASRLAGKLANHYEGTIQRLLDAGAGTGASTRPLKEISESVVALDLSRPMLAENPSSLRVQGDFDSLPFRSEVFDTVAFTASLFLTPTPTTAVAEAQRVVSPSGVVGAVSPEGWYIEDEEVFQQVGRESRSPSATSTVRAAFEETFDTVSGIWRFELTAKQLRQFHEIPAVAARLYPRHSPEERIAHVRSLLADVEGTGEQHWRWMVGQ